MTIYSDIDLIWTQEFMSLGIDYNVSKLNAITELNLKHKLIEIEKLCSFGNVEIYHQLAKPRL